MIIEIRKGHPKSVGVIAEILSRYGNEIETIEGRDGVYNTLHVVGDARPAYAHLDYIRTLPGVERAWRISSSYKNIARVVSGQDGRAISRDCRVVEISGPDGQVRRFGGGKHVFVVGPDSVQTEAQVFEQARQIAALADEKNLRDRIMFRAGAFKPRTRPTDFRGLGMEGIKLLDRVRQETGIPYVSEVMDHTLVEELAGHLDCFQIGTRNAQDFKLLETVGRTGMPVILKRGFGNDAEEWFNAAEYIANQQNLDIILCERGVKTMFAGKGYNRFTPDLNVMSYVRKKTILPVIFDPSHPAGDDRRVVENLVSSLPFNPAGTITEIIHSEAFRPHQLCDARQALPMECFRKAVEAVLAFEEAVQPWLLQSADYFRRRDEGALSSA